MSEYEPGSVQMPRTRGESEYIVSHSDSIVPSATYTLGAGMSLTFNPECWLQVNVWKSKYQEGDAEQKKVAMANLVRNGDYMDDGICNGSFSEDDAKTEFDLTDGPAPQRAPADQNKPGDKEVLPSLVQALQYLNPNNRPKDNNPPSNDPQQAADAAQYDDLMKKLPMDVQQKLKEKFGGADTEEEKAKVVRYVHQHAGTDGIDQGEIEALKTDLGIQPMTTHKWTQG